MLKQQQEQQKEMHDMQSLLMLQQQQTNEDYWNASSKTNKLFFFLKIPCGALGLGLLTKMAWTSIRRKKISTVTVLDVQWLEFRLYFDVIRGLKIYIFHEWIRIDADSHNKAKLFVVFNFIWH